MKKNDGRPRKWVSKNVGVSRTTPTVVRKFGNQFVARMGVALFGQTNMTDHELDAIRRNPFHKEFYDNYAEGVGATEEEAVKAMDEDAMKIGNSLFGY